MAIILTSISAIFLLPDGAPYPVNAITLATDNDMYGTWTFEMDTGMNQHQNLQNKINVIQGVTFKKKYKLKNKC